MLYIMSNQITEGTSYYRNAQYIRKSIKAFLEEIKLHLRIINLIYRTSKQ